MSHLIMLCTLAAVGANVQVVRTEGAAVQGELASLDSQHVSVKTEADVVATAWANVLEVRWTDVRPQLVASPQTWVRLRDGSLLLGEQFATQPSASVVLLDETEQSLPSRAIRSVRFQDNASLPQLRQQWEELLEQDASGDFLVVRKTIANKDDPNAPPQYTLDYLEGVVRQVTETEVHFEFDGDLIQAPREKLEGVIYYRPAAPQKAPFCFLEDAYGSRWALASLEQVGESGLRFTTVSGVTHELPQRRVMRCDFSLGKVLPLEELRWEIVEQESFYDLGAAGALSKKFFQPRFGGAINGTSLLLDGTAYSQGITLHSRTVAAFQIPPGFRRFQAVVGIDDRAGRQGNVSLEIIADGKVIGKYVVRGSDPAFPIDLDIQKTRRLIISVDYGAGRDVQDRLNLCDARIAK